MICKTISQIQDPLILEGVSAAVEKTLTPAAQQIAYPGHFMVTADGGAFGPDYTWPGLDSWEMAGAYLLLGQARLVLDYFDFVHASQRADGNIPWAIFPAEKPLDTYFIRTYFNKLRFPEDVFTYTPEPHEGQPPHSDRSARQWIGNFQHWQPKANPLSTLAPVSYLLTAGEIHATLKDDAWLGRKLDSLEATGRYLLSQRSENGLVTGSGFYIEMPPRYQWDGITQCYTVYALRTLAQMNQALGRSESAAAWEGHATELAARFRELFWRNDHFAEYLHPEHGLVDHHGLSDVNWAAVGLGVATEEQAKLTMARMLAERSLWHGDMPTQLVSQPYAYQAWELNEPLSFDPGAGHGPLYDVAAMGRVWYLESLACARVGAQERLRESTRQVCAMGQRHGWFWHERYHPVQNGTVCPSGPLGYCEYAAVLVRVVLGNVDIFSKPHQP